MRQPGMSNPPFSSTRFPSIALPSTGIGPEQFAFISVDGGYTGQENPATTAQLDFNAKHGFYITAPDYVLRPEVLESNFYAWRVTGDPKYLDRAALAVTKFEEYLKVKETGGYTGLYDVDNTNSQRIDDTESFWYAEVLKYL
jgi:mannosyl-oligosaccharide alpha-1,2-mannosidase